MVLNESGGDVAIVSETAAAPSVSWGAVIAGAVAAAAVSLLLMLLGSGLGLTIISPWAAIGTTITTVGVWALVWLVVVHWIGSAVGGYMAGRLRSGWTGLHRDEVTFRDTAHGFLTWGIAVLLVAILGGVAASAVLFSGVSAVATVTGGAVQGAAQGAAGAAASSNPADPNAYYVDTLFRAAPGAAPSAGSAPAAGAATAADTRAEVGRILAKDIPADQFPPDDRTYLATLVAARTGLAPDAAQMRVDQVITSLDNAKAAAKDAADKARKATASAVIGLVLALVIGAFVASVAAALGGHLRDEPSPYKRS